MDRIYKIDIADSLRVSSNMRQTVPNGFLLFEVFLAIAVVSIGIVVILQSFSVSLRCFHLSGQYYEALLLLENTMWELEAEAEISSELDSLEDEFECTVETVTIEGDKEETDELGRVLQRSTLKEVTVTVSWEGRGRTHSISAVTYIVERPEEESDGEEHLPPM